MSTMWAVRDGHLSFGRGGSALTLAIGNVGPRQAQKLAQLLNRLDVSPMLAQHWITIDGATASEQPVDSLKWFLAAHRLGVGATIMRVVPGIIPRWSVLGRRRHYDIGMVLGGDVLVAAGLRARSLDDAGDLVSWLDERNLDARTVLAVTRGRTTLRAPEKFRLEILRLHRRPSS